MAHRSRQAGRVLTLALASTLGTLAPVTLDRSGLGWQVAGAAGSGKVAGAGAGGSGKAAGAGAYGQRAGGAAPPSGPAGTPRGAAGAAGSGANDDDGPSNGGVDDGAPGPAAPSVGVPGRGAAGGGAPTGAAQGGNAPRGAMGAVGRRGIGDSNSGRDPPDPDTAPAASPAGSPRDDAAPTVRVAPVAPVRRTGGDLTRDLEQVGEDLSPSEEAALIANQWQR